MRREQSEAIKEKVSRIHHLVQDLLDLDAVFSSRRSVVFRGRPRVPFLDFEVAAGGRLAAAGYDYDIEMTQPPGTLVERVLLSVRLEAPVAGFPWLNVLLFLLTIGSTMLLGGVAYSVWLLAILGAHEFGHYFAARHHNMDVSLPYFLPAPPLFVLGTFGAFIQVRSPIRDRRALFDMAVAGPLAGFVVALVALVVGLSLSTTTPASESAGGFILGESLLFKALGAIVLPNVASDANIILHPVAFAGWAGMLVTMLNLLPMAQLDGGHIAYAMFGRWQKHVAYATMAALAIASIWWIGWLLWVVIGYFLRPEHPPTMVDEIPIDSKRRALGWLALAIFVVTVMPTPLSL